MRIGPNTIIGFLVFLFLIFVSLAIQSTLINEVLSAYLYPDVTLIIVVYVGLRRGLTEGVIWTLLISYFYSLHSSFSLLACALLMLLVFFASRYVVNNFYLLKKREFFLGIAVPILAQKIVLALWLYWHNITAMMLSVLQGVTTTISSALVGLLILKFLTRMDVWSGRLDNASLVGKKD